MKYFEWDKKKNLVLMKERKVSFEIIVAHIQEENILDRIKHPNEKNYPNQFMYIIELNDYVYMVPYVEDDEKIFLKTIIPSRKLTKIYLNK